ncbi:hypothetical protein M9H77_28561 [Catharanthus roseus]|uniref:Uncharacterized protein n=1 Tax=Catharanthus roseus TaxID=4058 RepID=A0ACC0AK06_CATRO|nr:hypothetical protein M9H77_28561 [Catharanthus roseus]
MKNKCFKRIKDEKQRKHGKGSNKTHDFDSDEPPLELETNPMIPTQSSSAPVPSSIPENPDLVLEGSDEKAEHPEAQAQALRDYQLARDRVRRVPKEHPRYAAALLCPTASYDRRLSWIFRRCTGDGFQLRSRSEGPITPLLTSDTSTRLIPHSRYSASCLSLGSSLLLPAAIARGGGKFFFQFLYLYFTINRLLFCSSRENLLIPLLAKPLNLKESVLVILIKYLNKLVVPKCV